MAIGLIMINQHQHELAKLVRAELNELNSLFVECANNSINVDLKIIEHRGYKEIAASLSVDLPLDT
jgi:hypothetical protein